ncbi:hypothetical protein Phage2-1_00092 [Achromobacter phage 2-1]|nr:hypothetical protein Phage2-1_00092 [Achromobacter phage 2-1]
MDEWTPDCGPFRTLAELKARIAVRAPTLIARINEILADHLVLNVDTHYGPCWPISGLVTNEIAVDTGCVILCISTDHGRRWSATFTEHREQLEPA